MYAITGNYPAQDFFDINERDGRITVKKDLKEDVARANKYIVSYILSPSLTRFYVVIIYIL